MPACARPSSFRATPLRRPSSRNVPSWLFMKRRLGLTVAAAIFIKIGCCHRQTVTRSHLRDARGFTYIRERPVAVVSIKPVPAGGQPARPARDRNPQPEAAAVLSGDRGLLKGKPHVVRDKEVEVTVAIIVQEAATGAPALLMVPEPGLFGHIGEGAITIIAIENVLPKAGAENVVKAVVVIEIGRAHV